MRPLRYFLTTILCVALVSTGARQQNGSAARGAAVLTPDLVRQHINVIAHDSMMGRDTPSRGLELTAQYVADNFKRFGLKPGGGDGSFLQRYRIARQKIDGEHSWARFQIGDVRATASLERDARYVSGGRLGKPIAGAALLLGGVLDSQAVRQVDIKGHVVLLVGDYTRTSLADQNAWTRFISSRGPAAVIVISNREPKLFAEVVRRQFIEQTTIVLQESEDAQPPEVEVHERSLAGVLARAGLELASVRASSHPVVQRVSDLQVTVQVGDVAQGDLTAPNTVGILEGTDPVLKNEYIVFSAHMDHVGVNGSASGDSIWNGADDDASGTTGVIALAEAFARARPRRSMIFLTVSGEEKGLWGSQVFAANPPVPIAQIVADLNLDMIGRNWRDTIVVIGKEHSDLGATLNRVNAAHPELGMTAIDDIWPAENFYGRSDHYNFAERGVPILFFFNGTHADYHQPSDSPEKIDTEKEARILKLVYYLGQQVGNAAARPKWNPESYKKIVKER